MRLRRLLPVIVLLGGLAGLLAWLALTPAPALEAGPLVVEIPAHEGILGIADRLGRAADRDAHTCCRGDRWPGRRA